MPSLLSWIDYDTEAQQRAQRILTLFKERDTRDELGFGPIRDAISDTLFPGSSVIHTRLRYMLFIPWMYRALEEKHVPSSKIREYARAEQLRLAERLKENAPDEFGIIGGDVGDKLKTLPSAIYWAGLGRWGLRVYPGTEGQYQRALDETYSRRKRARAGLALASEHGDDIGGLWELGAHTFHPGLPPAPEGFPDTATFRLSRAEARYLQERVRQSCPGSLLADLLSNPSKTKSETPWAHPHLADFRPEHRELVHHGWMFSLVTHGAAALYNLMLAELLDNEEKVSLLQERRDAWLEQLASNLADIAAWAEEFPAFWSAVHGRGHDIGARTVAFVEDWVSVALRHRERLFVAPDARALIKNREIEKKKAHSRFTNARVRDQWGGSSGMRPMVYRWPLVQTYVSDMAAALKVTPMLLSPNNRAVYTDALTPPAGFQLDTAVAATFSMDLTTLLSVPLQLVLQATEDRDELMRDPISLYEALQRATERVHVFAQCGRIQAPRQHHLLFSLLEPMITEVSAPRGGAFHPKIWVLRFTSGDGDATRYRLLLASKNLTADRCWDVALALDGEPGRKADANGAEIAAFVSRLPELARTGFVPTDSYKTLAAELQRVAWELPEGFETLRFHVLGIDERSWKPANSRRLVVISPFVGPRALNMLAATSDIPLAVISRSEALSDLTGSLPFRDAYVLHDAAETEDGEDSPPQRSELGLHAKVYMCQADQVTYLTVGSANATDAALIARNNVEILAELSGSTYKVGSVLNFLNPDHDAGLGQYLVPWSADEASSTDAAARENEKRLEAAREALLAAGLHLQCRQEGANWKLGLGADRAVDTAGLKTCRAWPVTVGADRAVDIATLAAGSDIHLQVQDISSLTTLIAFRLEAGSEALTFTLNLPVTGMPEERDRAILRRVIENRQGFLRYLLLLLAGLGDGADVGEVARAFNRTSAKQASGAFEDMPLLEELVRAFSRDRPRLQKVQRLIDDLTKDEAADDILPDGFLALWQVFRRAIAAND